MTGKRPVLYVEILPVILMDFNNAILVQTRGSLGGTDGVIISDVVLSMGGVVVILVDQTIFCY